MRLAASAALSSTTSRPPPSSGTRMIKLRPSLVTSIGPSPVRGFIAAIRKIPSICPKSRQPGRAGSASQLQPAAPLGRPPWPGTFRCFVLALGLLSRNYLSVANQTRYLSGLCTYSACAANVHVRADSPRRRGAEPTPTATPPRRSGGGRTSPRRSPGTLWIWRATPPPMPAEKVAAAF